MNKIFAVYYFVLCMTSFVESNRKKTYDRYQVVEIRGVADIHDDELYKKLDLRPEEHFRILHRNKDEGTVDALVKPDILDRFKEALKRNQFPYEVIDPDVGKAIREQEIIEGRAQPLDGRLTFNRIMEFEEIRSYLRKVAKENKNKLKLTNIGKSIEGVNIPMVTISTGKCSNRIKKPVIFIEAGIHGREWLTMPTALYTISQLLNLPKFTRNVDWQIIPLMNPDGYKYSRKTDRFWRKNRRIFDKASKCKGVDLNRNFDANWGGPKSEVDKCRETYAGDKAFSEPESRAVRDAFNAVKDRVMAYVSVHSYGKKIMWISNKKIKTGCIRWMEKVGENISKSIQMVKGEKFTHGFIENIIGIVKGNSPYWALQVGDSLISLAIELRGKGHNGFFPPNSEILNGVKEFWTAMMSLHDVIIEHRDTCLVLKKDYSPCFKNK